MRRKRKGNEPMSLSKNYNLKYTLNGVAWLVYAVLNLMPNTVVVLSLSVVALFIAVVTSCIAIWGKTDNEDEMSILHLAKAKASTLDIIIIVFMIIGIVSIFFKDLTVQIYKLYSFVIGIVQLLTGVYFWIEERTSD